MMANLWFGCKVVASAGSTLVHWSSSLARTVFDVPFGGLVAPDGANNTLDVLGDSLCRYGNVPSVTACALAFDTDSPVVPDGKSNCPIYEGQQDANSPTILDDEPICPASEGQQDEEGDHVGRKPVGPLPGFLQHWVSTYPDVEKARRRGSGSPVGYSDPDAWTSRWSLWLFRLFSVLKRSYSWYCRVLECILLGLPLAWIFGGSTVTAAQWIYLFLERIFGHVERDLYTRKKKKKKKKNESNEFSWESFGRTVVGSMYFMWTAMRALDCVGIPSSVSHSIVLLLYAGLVVVFGADFLDFRWVARWTQMTLLFGFVMSINAAMILFHVGTFAASLQFDALRTLRAFFCISIVAIRLAFAVIRCAFIRSHKAPDTLPDGLYSLSLGDNDWLSISPTDTVAKVKKEIQSVFGVSMSNQKLIFHGGVLDDDERTLASYGVDGSSTLILLCGNFGDVRCQDQSIPVSATDSADYSICGFSSNF